ncbi:hypothetical protein HRG_008278 [Hirsutella rhossiliensis]|uniref:Uncharacterized protein n=1 Tax=Hirsutella rhossiliensis TaxID=111463 RepID=A0A9P8MTU7_9HYPO|nr:uncharacterized protein HRG_08278 [Hirsutella rhossiliensis]KAH0961125.1 hypothetical protein HRG_08278 [Hirsutella rhossiliensis]
MSSSRPRNPKCVGVRMVDHVEGALEEFDLWEMELLYMVVLPTAEVVGKMYAENCYVDVDFSLLANENTEARRVCFGIVYRLMLQQFMLNATAERVFSKQTDAAEELKKRDDYTKRLTEDYERLKREFRRYYAYRVIGTEAHRGFRVAAVEIEAAWMKGVRGKYADLDLVNEIVWLDV